MTKALAVRDEQALEQYGGFSASIVDLVRDQICRGSSDEELRWFLNHCARLKIEPMARHAFLVRRWDSKARAEVPQIQMSVDGFRSVAAATGRYLGQAGPFWCGADGEWKDVWVGEGYPAAAKVGVYVQGNAHPTWGVATWKEYVQTTKDGTVTSMWKKFAPTMIAKCAESQALRKAFPFELGGTYTNEEMAQADNAPTTSARVVEAPERDVIGEALANLALDRGYAARSVQDPAPVATAPAAQEAPVPQAPKPAAGGITVEQLREKLEGIVSEAASLTAELGVGIPLAVEPPADAPKAAWAAAITTQATSIIAELESYLRGRGASVPQAAGSDGASLKAHREELVRLARGAGSSPAEEDVPIGDEIPV